MNSVAGDYDYLELITNSKSGSFFFYSHDRRYIIKNMKVRSSHTWNNRLIGLQHFFFASKCTLQQYFGGCVGTVLSCSSLEKVGRSVSGDILLF